MAAVACTGLYTDMQTQTLTTAPCQTQINDHVDRPRALPCALLCGVGELTRDSAAMCGVLCGVVELADPCNASGACQIQIMATNQSEQLFDMNISTLHCTLTNGTIA